MQLNGPSSARFTARALLAVLGTVLVTALLAACGSDDDSGGDTDASASSSGSASGTASEDGGSDLLASAREDGITIGIANERPYGYEDGGDAVGEAPDLAKEVFSRLGIDDIDFQVVDFQALINGLNAGRFDVIAAGMFINPERAEQVAFADPDYCGTTAFAVADDNPMGLTDFESITESGAKLGVLSGAVEQEYALSSGVPEGQIDAYQSTPDVFDALTAGRVDAVALTAITVREQVADLDGYEATEGFVPVIDGEEQLGCGAFAFRPDDADFRDEFNEVLKEMQEAGEILPIIEKYGFTQVEVDAAAGVTAAELSES